MQKAWLQRIIESPEYFRRLIIEYCTERAANIERRERIENLSKDYIIEHYEKIEKRLDNVAGYSNWITHLPNYYETCIGVHEFAHQSTNHGIYLSTYAKNLYKLAFDSSKVDGKIIVAIGKTDREYYGDPKELDAMKKELEFELERLEIKKYEETFTHEHYVQIMQLINQGLFTSYRIKVFLKVIRPEFMEQIMNTIT